MNGVDVNSQSVWLLLSDVLRECAVGVIVSSLVKAAFVHKETFLKKSFIVAAIPVLLTSSVMASAATHLLKCNDSEQSEGTFWTLVTVNIVALVALKFFGHRFENPPNRITDVEFFHNISKYEILIKKMSEDEKQAFDARLAFSAGLSNGPVQKPTSAEAVKKLDSRKLIFSTRSQEICTNFMKGMDAETRTAVEIVVVDSGMLDEDISKFFEPSLIRGAEPIAVRAIHRNHERLFGTDPKFTDRAPIEALNLRYKELDLPEKQLPEGEELGFSEAEILKWIECLQGDSLDLPEDLC